MKEAELNNLLTELLGQGGEREWIEFKHNFHSVEEIGKTISAVANATCLCER